MAVRKIIKMGHPLLMQPAAKVLEFNTPALDQLIEDMQDTMSAYDGAGLAATQIAVMQQVVIFGFDQNRRYPNADAVPKTVLINPEMTPLNDEQENGWEGCLSIPGMRGLVPRFKKILYRGYSPDGEAIEATAEGFHARVVQHEVDHLLGILYPYRIKNLQNFGYEDELFNRNASS